MIVGNFLFDISSSNSSSILSPIILGNLYLLSYSFLTLFFIIFGKYSIFLISSWYLFDISFILTSFVGVISNVWYIALKSFDSLWNLSAFSANRISLSSANKNAVNALNIILMIRRVSGSNTEPVSVFDKHINELMIINGILTKFLRNE